MRKVKKGMTILEIVIGLAIIGIMLLPLANGLLTSVSANKKAEETQQAKLLGQQVIEKLKVENRIDNAIEIPFHNDKLIIDNGIEDTTGKKTFPIKSNSAINDFSINGKIIEEEGVVAINDIAYNTSTKMNKEVGLYIEVDRSNDNKIILRYIERAVNLEKLNDLVVYEGILKKEKVFSDLAINLDIKIKNDGKVQLYVKNTNFDILTNNNLNGAIVIYIKNVKQLSTTASTVNIEIENENISKFEEIQILRDISISEVDWKNGLEVECKNKINKFDNIIYDVFNKKRGLYTIDLEIIKKDKVVEKSKAQFYLEN